MRGQWRVDRRCEMNLKLGFKGYANTKHFTPFHPLSIYLPTYLLSSVYLTTYHLPSYSLSLFLIFLSSS